MNLKKKFLSGSFFFFIKFSVFLFFFFFYKLPFFLFLKFFFINLLFLCCGGVFFSFIPPLFL
ncbi:hypothetical protein FE569_19250 [Clostridioides difficile]|nr:hypothetical protein [Clostridioides difficile]